MDGDDLDFGHGTTGRWLSYGGVERAGIVERHQCDGPNCRIDLDADAPGRCGGRVMFDLPGVREHFRPDALWQVVSWEPLTLSPSIQCGHGSCTHHGWIREGRWEPAG